MKLVATSLPLALLLCATTAVAEPAKPARAKAAGEAPPAGVPAPPAKAPTAKAPAATPLAKPVLAPAAKAAPAPAGERVVPPPGAKAPPLASSADELPNEPVLDVELDEEVESEEEPSPDAPLARKATVGQHAQRSTKERGVSKGGRVIDVTPRAPTPPPEPEPPEPPGFGEYQQHFTLGLGLRLNWFADEAYNQFSDKPLLGQFTLGGGYVFPIQGALSVAVKLGWDVGGRSSTLRGLATALDVHRFTLGPSLRYHLHRRLFVSAGVMPGVRHSVASLLDSGVSYSGGQAAFAMDLLAGAEFQVMGKPRNDAGFPRWWVGLEGGYSLGTSSAVVLDPGEDAPARTAPLTLLPVELGGGLLRMTTSITY